MSSQAAITVHRWTSLGDGRIEATVTLACGCVVTRQMPADRGIETEDGAVRVVGKFPCPQGHPVRRPPVEAP